MAKKHFGRFVALAAIAGAAAAGISYFLRYKSFHKELDEDFHDFEDDFDEDLKDFEDVTNAGKNMTRNYVPLNTDRQPEKDCTSFGEDEDEAEEADAQAELTVEELTEDGAVVENSTAESTTAESTTAESTTAESTTAESTTADGNVKVDGDTANIDDDNASAGNGTEETAVQQTGGASAAEPAGLENIAPADPGACSDGQKENFRKMEQPATVIIEDTTE